jgi:hypothetical protein
VLQIQSLKERITSIRSKGQQCIFRIGPAGAYHLDKHWDKEPRTTFRELGVTCQNCVYNISYHETQDLSRARQSAERHAEVFATQLRSPMNREGLMQPTCNSLRNLDNSRRQSTRDRTVRHDATSVHQLGSHRFSDVEVVAREIDESECCLETVSLLW